MTSVLNWHELERFITQISIESKNRESLFVDRIVIPERSYFPEGYLKGEWALRLAGRKKEWAIVFNIRPHQPYFTFCQGRGPQAAVQATHSPFDLSLSKHLRGAKWIAIQVLHRERIVILWFSQPQGISDTRERLGLILFLIPSLAEAILVSCREDSKKFYDFASAQVLTDFGWPILARSRVKKMKIGELFFPPPASKPPQLLSTRDHLLMTPYTFSQVIEKELQEEAFLLRFQSAEKAIKNLLKQAKNRFDQSSRMLKAAEQGRNWKVFADEQKARLCFDQIEKFYQNAKKQQRQIQEAHLRMERFYEVQIKLEKCLNQKPQLGDWSALEKWEQQSGCPVEKREKGSINSRAEKKKSQAWLGKTFRSKEGLMIWVGRSKDENLELTFKSARGNDLWMHLKGRPGAHTVIPLSSGKSASLETLLDAAQLTLIYSGGKNWGKTEVDYTFKKYVKRIKDSTEASYTHNKTFLVAPDPVRLHRLFEEETLL